MSTTFQVANGDVVINRSSGQARLVADETKLRQDLRMALATGSRPDNVGAGLEDAVNGQAATPALVTRQVSRRVRIMVSNIQDLQSRFQREQRPRGERLVRLGRLQVSQVADDPTAFYFRATFITGRTGTSGSITIGGRLT
jgi:hypothetical protein